MLKVYKMTPYVSIDNQEWRKVYYDDDLFLIDLDKDGEVKLLDNATFEKCYNTRLLGVYRETTFFKKKPVIKIRYGWEWDAVVAYKHFDSISYKIVYKEIKDMPLTFIMSHFPADKAIQYLKERGITTCPNMK